MESYPNSSSTSSLGLGSLRLLALSHLLTMAPYETVGSVAAQYGMSRQWMYQLKERAEEALLSASSRS